MNNTNERYKDFFDEQDDAAQAMDVTHLETIYTNATAPDTLSWEHLNAQFQVQKQEQIWWKHLLSQQQKTIAVSRSSHPFKPSRLALVATLAISLVLFATVVYASGGSILDLLLQRQQSTQQLAQDHSYTNINLSKTIDGFTFTLDKAYADANRVILGYTVTPPKSDKSTASVPTRFAPPLSELKTQQGTILRTMGGLGSSNVGINGLVMSYNAMSIQGTPSQLNLDLKVAYGSQQSDGTFHIQHWLTYDFTVPFHAGRVANVQQVQTSNGQTITLERAVVAPSETRLCLKGLQNSGSRVPDTTFLSPDLSVGNLSADGTGTPDDFLIISIHDETCGNDMWSVSINNTQFFEQHGTWTLTLKPDSRFKDIPASLKGSFWTFHFTVPEL